MNVHSGFIHDSPNLEITHLLLWLGNGQKKYDTSIPQYQQEEGTNFETTCILYLSQDRKQSQRFHSII